MPVRGIVYTRQVNSCIKKEMCR